MILALPKKVSRKEAIGEVSSMVCAKKLVIVGDFSEHITLIDRASRSSTNKKRLFQSPVGPVGAMAAISDLLFIGGEGVVVCVKAEDVRLGIMATLIC